MIVNFKIDENRLGPPHDRKLYLVIKYVHYVRNQRNVRRFGDVSTLLLSSLATKYMYKSQNMKSIMQNNLIICFHRFNHRHIHLFGWTFLILTMKLPNIESLYERMNSKNMFYFDLQKWWSWYCVDQLDTVLQEIVVRLSVYRIACMMTMMMTKNDRHSININNKNSVHFIKRNQSKTISAFYLII